MNEVEQTVPVRKVGKRNKLTQVSKGQKLTGMSETGILIVESCQITQPKKP